jgi:hypothetical protein
MVVHAGTSLRPSQEEQPVSEMTQNEALRPADALV